MILATILRIIKIVTTKFGWCVVLYKCLPNS
jgi:hypothetical protein